jgi:hypothetical protein
MQSKPDTPDTSTAITQRTDTTGSSIAVLRYDPAELRQLVDEIYGGTPTMKDFTQIPQPADGTLHFAVVTPAGEEHPQTLTGVLLQTQLRRAHWIKPFSGKGVKPDCSSSDGKTGVGTPGGSCSVCPLATFGDDGSAPKCSETIDLVYVGLTEQLPSVLKVHKMSIEAVARYRQLLLNYGLGLHSVVTELGLAPAQYQNGFKYTKLALSTVRLLSPTEHAHMVEIAAIYGMSVIALRPFPEPSPVTTDLPVMVDGLDLVVEVPPSDSDLAS